MKAGLWLLLIMVAAMGCEIDTRTDGADGSKDSSSSTDNTSSTDGNSATVSDDQAEWDAISWNTGTGPSCKGAVKVMTLTSAKISSDGNKVSFSWDRYPWSGMGLGHFFVWTGSGWKGGKFDWIRQGGQSVKLLENVHEGYNGLRAPPSGTPVAFAWTSSDGDERSNLVKTTWP